MKVLAVDDDPLSLHLLLGLLGVAGQVALSASNLAAAKEACEDPTVRIVVSDWQLREEDGLELCRHLRRRGGDYVYFILLTQKPATNENMDLAWNAGVDDFLCKPLNERELRMRLHVAMRIVEYAKQVRQLKQIIPICSFCKKIRDDRDYWDQLERYIQTHTGSKFSHGICPDCYQRHIIPQMGGDPDDQTTES